MTMATDFHNTVIGPGIKVMEKYIFLREIGSGSFGKVFLVKSKQGGINYVVKQVDLNKLDRKQTQSAAKEVEVLSKLRHNNIVSYKESYEKNNQLNIVLEYCENGDLYDKIKEKRMTNKVFADNEILDYFVQICLALEYIHTQKILHRDLKTKNIFLTKGNIIKLGDFGIAKVLENSFELAQTCIGSPFYVSPEICESKPYNKKSDVWALGCVLYELATLRYAFVAKNVKNLVTKILTGAHNPLPSNMNIQIRSLITVMLKPNPKDRPSVRELLEKRFLMKRRATFICKAHKSDLIKERSRSGDVSKNFPSAVFKNQPKQKKHSLSCLQLNQQERKFTDISNPEFKYKPFNHNQGSKSDRKLTALNKNEMILNNLREEKKEKSCPDLVELSPRFLPKVKSKNSNLENLTVKLSKVDSEYYELIAGCENLEKKENSVGKQITSDEPDLKLSKLKLKPRPDSEGKMWKVEERHARVTEGGEDFRKDDEKMDKSNLIGNGSEQDQRKKWVKDTLQRKTLLAILGDTELLEGSLSLKHLEGTSEKLGPNASIDDMLSLKPSEIGEDVLLPVKVHDVENNSFKNNQFQLLQHEVIHLREKFEMNNRQYQLEDLIRLTDNTKKILNLDTRQKFTEYERKMEESVYYNLECRRMTLEKRVGFCKFFKVYGKMMDIINDEFESSLKTSLENPIDGQKTYIIPRVSISGDGDDVMKNTWKLIINVLEDKQEHLPDIWELAVSESIYYNL